MNSHLKILTSGLLISFLGSLPLGTLNTTAFQIAASQNIGQAIVFVLAAIFVEIIAVVITLTQSHRISYNSKALSYLFPVAVALLIYLSVSNFASANTHQSFGANSPVFPMIRSSFLLGTILSILNPMHVPFWLGWNNVLAARKTLNNKPGMYSAYITGISLGSFASYLIFIFSGNYIFQSYEQYASEISNLMGLVYLSFAVFLGYKFLSKHFRLSLQ